MEENTGSFHQLWICDASQYLDFILSAGGMSNTLQMEEDFAKIEIPFTVDTGTYTEQTKEEKGADIHSFTMKCSLPFSTANQAIIDSLPSKKLLVFKDYEGRYKAAGSKMEPIIGVRQLKHNADFNKGKFYSLEFSRKLKLRPLFITNPFITG